MEDRLDKYFKTHEQNEYYAFKYPKLIKKEQKRIKKKMKGVDIDLE